MVQSPSESTETQCDHLVWQPIATAPKDGTWFLICCDRDGFESYEIGAYAPRLWPEYVPAGGGFYRKVNKQVSEWRGFNNLHRATHWMPLPKPPVMEEA